MGLTVSQLNDIRTLRPELHNVFNSLLKKHGQSVIFCSMNKWMDGIKQEQRLQRIIKSKEAELKKLREGQNAKNR